MLPPHVGSVPAELASLLLVLISQHAHLGHTSKGTWGLAIVQINILPLEQDKRCIRAVLAVSVMFTVYPNI